ncbi:MAG: ABC transporter permease [Solirubrobacterales bacterium]|nr:ABC transporter permease [Solirubrobacterales bacterium]MBV9917643.1 ABC transporter permease [Solirubrobacterales bacterium]
MSATTESQPAPSGLRTILNPDRRKIIYGFVAAIGLFIIGEIVKPGFASASGIQQILEISSFVGIVAAGQTFVILVGGIDLSVPWVLNAAAIVLISQSAGSNGKLAIGIVLALVLGLACGIVNGLGIVLLGIPAVVMTLGMNGIVEGLSLGVTHGLSCGGCLKPAPTALVNAMTGKTLGIDTSLLIWIGIIIVVSFVLSFTTFGRRIYAVGNSERVSFLAGVNVKLVTVTLYALSGLFAAAAGIALAGFGGSATLGMGDPYLFQSIAAVVIGGTYILGGRGHYLGTVAGAIVLTTLISVLLAKSAPDYARDIVYGVVILAILLLYGRQRSEA